MVLVVEIAIAVTVVGWFMAPNIKDLMDSARSLAASRYKWYKDIQSKLLELALHLEHISGVVDKAAARPGFVRDPTVIARLWRIKDAVHDAEELLDKFQYEILEANLNLNKKRQHPVSKATDSALDLGKQIIGSKESLNELVEQLKNLERLRQDAAELLQDSQRDVQPPERTNKIMGFLSTRDKLFGYDREYACLLSRLVPPGGDARQCSGGGTTTVVAIIGHGGMGKTELARRAFNDEENVVDKFGLRIWACVYAKFTETDLLREIWNSAAGREPVGDMNVTSLQLELKKMVMESSKSRRYLLVLDDVCHDESAATDRIRRKTWEAVLAPFKQNGGPGSRILMTTRAEICSNTLDADPGARIVLSGMDTNAITLMLKHDVLKKNDEHEPVPAAAGKQQEAFDEVVRKLQGSPLAAEEVISYYKLGVDCRGRGQRAKWKEASLGNKHLHGVVHAHMSSYQLLPPQLQRCLAFCSIFPLNWRFERGKLIKMWMAHGFAEGYSPADGRAVAGDYFDALLQRSLFQQAGTAVVKEDDGPPRRDGHYYVIHEHIHSMLRQVCPTYYLSIDGERDATIPIPITVRHLSITGGCCVDQLGACPDEGLKKLRTLLVFNGGDASSSSSSLSSSAALITAMDNGILKRLKGARVVDFSGTSLTQAPESIGELKHLRYLGLPNTITRLGAHVTKLLLLQTLAVASKDCKLQELPEDMSKLTNMRHLDLDREYIAQIPAIGGLEHLQCSIEFHAGRSREGHSMRELKKLNSLRPKLIIKGLETVASKEEAQSAELGNKAHLEVLKLEWGHRVSEQSAAGGSDPDPVLQGLRPHHHLERLHITRYAGTTSPAWLADGRVLQNLRSLYLRNCRKLQALPPLGGLPRLKVLNITELPAVTKIDYGMFCGSSSLERIVLDDMEKLVAWDAKPADGATPPICFPQLRDVRIVDCPELSSVSALLCCRGSLSDLHMERCHKVAANFSRSSFPSLTATGLNILDCSGPQFQE